MFFNLYILWAVPVTLCTSAVLYSKDTNYFIGSSSEDDLKTKEKLRQDDVAPKILYFDGKVTKFELYDENCAFSVNDSKAITIDGAKMMCQFLQIAKQNHYNVHVEAEITGSKPGKFEAKIVKFLPAPVPKELIVQNDHAKKVTADGYVQDVLVLDDNRCYISVNSKKNDKYELIFIPVDTDKNCLFLINGYVKNMCKKFLYFKTEKAEFFYEKL